MSGKRKDNKGRLLRSGESQRKDLTYMYRYNDNDGTRKSVYAPSLAELRIKEEAIATRLRAGVVAGTDITVGELVKQYIGTKRNLKHTTARSYDVAYRHIMESSFSRLDVSKVTKSTVKRFYIELNEKGLCYSSVETIAKVLKPAFKQAVDDDIIIKNPCAFSLSEVLRDDTSPRKAISQDQLNRFFEFINSTPKFKRFYNEIAVLAYTGVRVSELCALTIGDVDFEKNRIAVNKQTAYTTQRGRYIETTKTESGNRYITIDPLLLPYLQEAVCAAKSRKLQPIVDGHSGFLFVTKHGEMCLGHDITTRVKTIWSKYNATHEEKLPNITPHILRHTFCTRCIELGIDVKSVQYFMGHASASVTMDIYSHASYASAEKAFMRVHSA